MLRFHDLAEVQRTRRHEHAHERKAHGDFISDNLRRRTHGTQEGVLRVRRPTGQDDAVNAHGGERQDVKQAGINIRDGEGGVERHHGPSRKRRHQRDDGSQQEQEPVRAGRHQNFLHQELEHVREGLQQAVRPHAVRANTQLHPANHLSLGQRGVCHAQDDHDSDQKDLQHDPDEVGYRGCQPDFQTEERNEQVLDEFHDCVPPQTAAAPRSASGVCCKAGARRTTASTAYMGTDTVAPPSPATGT